MCGACFGESQFSKSDKKKKKKFYFLEYKSEILGP